jgi:hypothetical protein
MTLISDQLFGDQETLSPGTPAGLRITENEHFCTLHTELQSSDSHFQIRRKVDDR